MLANLASALQRVPLAVGITMTTAIGALLSYGYLYTSLQDMGPVFAFAGTATTILCGGLLLVLLLNAVTPRTVRETTADIGPYAAALWLNGVVWTLSLCLLNWEMRLFNLNSIISTELVICFGIINLIYTHVVEVATPQKSIAHIIMAGLWGYTVTACDTMLIAAALGMLWSHHLLPATPWLCILVIAATTIAILLLSTLISTIARHTWAHLLAPPNT